MQRFFARILVYIYRRFGIASSFYYVNAGEALPPPLSKEEEEECIRALGAGDESVKQTLIERNLRHRRPYLDRDDRLNQSREYI